MTKILFQQGSSYLTLPYLKKILILTQYLVHFAHSLQASGTLSPPPSFVQKEDVH